MFQGKPTYASCWQALLDFFFTWLCLTFTGFIMKLIWEITDDLLNNWRQLFSRLTIKAVINNIPKFKAGGDTLLLIKKI